MKFLRASVLSIVAAIILILPCKGMSQQSTAPTEEEKQATRSWIAAVLKAPYLSGAINVSENVQFVLQNFNVDKFLITKENNITVCNAIESSDDGGTIQKVTFTFEQSNGTALNHDYKIAIENATNPTNQSGQALDSTVTGTFDSNASRLEFKNATPTKSTTTSAKKDIVGLRLTTHGADDAHTKWCRKHASDVREFDWVQHTTQEQLAKELTALAPEEVFQLYRFYASENFRNVARQLPGYNQFIHNLAHTINTDHGFRKATRNVDNFHSSCLWIPFIVTKYKSGFHDWVGQENQRIEKEEKAALAKQHQEEIAAATAKFQKLAAEKQRIDRAREEEQKIAAAAQKAAAEKRAYEQKAEQERLQKEAAAKERADKERLEHEQKAKQEQIEKDAKEKDAAAKGKRLEVREKLRAQSKQTTEENKKADKDAATPPKAIKKSGKSQSNDKDTPAKAEVKKEQASITDQKASAQPITQQAPTHHSPVVDALPKTEETKAEAKTASAPATNANNASVSGVTTGQTSGSQGITQRFLRSAGNTLATTFSRTKGLFTRKQPTITVSPNASSSTNAKIDNISATSTLQVSMQPELKNATVAAINTSNTNAAGTSTDQTNGSQGITQRFLRNTGNALSSVFNRTKGLFTKKQPIITVSPNANVSTNTQTETIRATPTLQISTQPEIRETNVTAIAQPLIQPQALNPSAIASRPTISASTTIASTPSNNVRADIVRQMVLLTPHQQELLAEVMQPQNDLASSTLRTGKKVLNAVARTGTAVMRETTQAVKDVATVTAHAVRATAVASTEVAVEVVKEYARAKLIDAATTLAFGEEHKIAIPVDPFAQLQTDYPWDHCMLPSSANNFSLLGDSPMLSFCRPANQQLQQVDSEQLDSSFPSSTSYNTSSYATATSTNPSETLQTYQAVTATSTSAAFTSPATTQTVPTTIILDSSASLDVKVSKEESKASNSLSTSDFSFTTPNNTAIATEIARRQAVEDAFIKQHSKDAYLTSVHQMATQFNTLCAQLSAYGDQARALAVMEVGKRLSQAGKRIAQCLDGIERGVVDGMKKSSVSAQEALNNPGAYCVGYLDALRELAVCSVDVTIFASKVLLRAAGNPELLQQQLATWLKETGSTLTSATANLTIEDAFAIPASLVTQVILNTATPAILLGSPSNFVLFTSSLKGFLDTFKATRQALNARKFLPERAKTLANPSEMIITEGAKILQTAEKEGIPVVQRALNTVENNKSMISECGSFGNAVARNAENYNSSIAKKAAALAQTAERLEKDFEALAQADSRLRKVKFFGSLQHGIKNHFFGSDEYCFEMIDPGGNQDKWLQSILNLAQQETGSVKNVPTGQTMEIFGKMAKSNSSEKLDIGVRLFKLHGEDTWRITTILTKQPPKQ